MVKSEEKNKIFQFIDAYMLLIILIYLGEEYLTEEEFKIAEKGLGQKKKELSGFYNISNDIILLAFVAGNILGRSGNSAVEALDDTKSEEEARGFLTSPNIYRDTMLNNLKNRVKSDFTVYREQYKNLIEDSIDNTNIKMLARILPDQKTLERKEFINGLITNIEIKEVGMVDGPLYSLNYALQASFNSGVLNYHLEEGTERSKELFYFDVNPDACVDCIRLYLTNGEGSDPKLFSIEELSINYTNIGKKRADWQPTIAPIHPHCRCTLRVLDEESVEEEA